MGILAADFLIGCPHFAKSKRRDRLLSAQGDGRWGEHTLCEAVPRVVVRRASPPRIVPARLSWPCTLPSPRASSSPSRRMYIFVVAVAVGHDEGGGRRAGGATRGAMTTRAGGETTRAGVRRAPEKTSAGKTARGGDDAGHTLTHECAPPASDAGHLLLSSEF